MKKKGIRLDNPVVIYLTVLIGFIGLNLTLQNLGYAASNNSALTSVFDSVLCKIAVVYVEFKKGIMLFALCWFIFGLYKAFLSAQPGYKILISGMVFCVVLPYAPDIIAGLSGDDSFAQTLASCTK